MRSATWRLMPLAVLAGVVTAVPAIGSAQDGWGVHRIGAHLGVASVSQADRGFEVGMAVDIGSLFRPQARLMLGANQLSAGVDRRIDDVPVPGSFRDITITSDLQIKLFRADRFIPYVGAGVGLHFLSPEDIPDQNVRDIYDGIVAGFNYMGGLIWDVTPDRRWSLTGEVRGTAAQNVGRTSFRAGGTVRFGRGSLVRH
jgi:opacity protein-like surface antigen